LAQALSTVSTNCETGMVERVAAEIEVRVAEAQDRT